MLLSLQKDLRNELHSSFSTLQHGDDRVEEHTADLEKVVTEHTAVYNKMADAYDHHTEEIFFLQAKVADLEDYSRGNNIKFRGIPETVKPPELISYLQQLFLLLLPELSQADITIELPNPIIYLLLSHETYWLVFTFFKLKNI